jgi:hypothetical protein
MQEEGVFIKLYAAAMHSGLIGALGADLWHTYSGVACYMNSSGTCHPSQELLAARLGISRTALNSRMKRLLAFEWNGKPLLTATRLRDPKTKKYTGTIYKFELDAAFSIF